MRVTQGGSVQVTGSGRGALRRWRGSARAALVITACALAVGCSMPPIASVKVQLAPGAERPSVFVARGVFAPETEASSYQYEAWAKKQMPVAAVRQSLVDSLRASGYRVVDQPQAADMEIDFAIKDMLEDTSGVVVPLVAWIYSYDTTHKQLALKIQVTMRDGATHERTFVSTTKCRDVWVGTAFLIWIPFYDDCPGIDGGLYHAWDPALESVMRSVLEGLDDLLAHKGGRS